MGLRLRSSPQTLTLLEVFLDQPTRWRHGYAVAQQTRLQSGTLYPMLMRLAKLKWLETRWEEPSEVGRPRHLYRLTSEGREWAREELRAARGRKSLRFARSEA
ncbi:MAG TPA: helix-turn-helix transcriptional regulator [Candidatus Dormibacteraeota bacterium]|nr:helix-turn-helix transcriptional regulator [Candidatus Dormibacteraeota bacterium]